MANQSATPENNASLAAFLAKIKGEPIASFLNINVLEVSPGYARVSMKMRPEFINFNGVVFGGIITAVADHAFSLAINSLVMPSLSTQFNINLFAPAAVGDELIGEGRVLKSGRRAGITEMTVTNQNGKLIAKATGITIPTTSP